VGAGIWPDFGVIDTISAVTDCEEPDEKTAALYEQILLKYKQATIVLGEWAL
jgi:hypothetical protein